MEVLETAVGAVFALTRFSLVRISARDLFADGRPRIVNCSTSHRAEIAQKYSAQKVGFLRRLILWRFRLCGSYCNSQAKNVRLGFDSANFSRISFLGRRILSPHFCGEKVPRKIILQENPQQKPPKLMQQKSPTHFCRGAAQKQCT